MLAEIEKKAQKIRDNRVAAASNKSIEDAVFEYFKNIEESRKIYNNEQYSKYLLPEAKKALAERIRGFDPNSKINIQ